MQPLLWRSAVDGKGYEPLQEVGFPLFAGFARFAIMLRLAVFLPNWIGDTCMAIPALAALRSLPDTCLAAVSRPGPLALLERESLFDEIYSYHPRARDESERRWGLIKRLRHAGFDAAVLMPGSLGVAAIARAAGIPRRIGFVGDCRRWLLSDPIAPAPDPRTPKNRRSLIDEYLRLVKPLGCEITDRRMRLNVDPQRVAAAQLLLRTDAVSDQAPLLVINNSASAATSRLWPTEYLVHLCRRLSSQVAVRILLHSGPKDRAAVNDVAAQIDLPNVVSMGQWPELPLSMSIAVMSLADLVLSSDSGARHLAVALDRPVIGLYGSTDPAATRTYNVEETAIEVFEECRPCYEDHCPLRHNRCMRNISIDKVEGAVLRHLRPQLRIAS